MNFETPEGRRTTSVGGAAVRLAGGPSPETLLSAVLDSATVAVFVKDRDGRYVLVAGR